MKTRRTIGLVLMILARFCSATEPPRPWMADRTQVDVIHLVCEPPPEGSHWKEVTDLRIFWLQQDSNMTLAIMNNHLERSSDPPKISVNLPPLSSASFSGSFGNKDPSLSVFLPMRSSNYAEIFYCDIDKTDSDANQASKMSSQIHVVTTGQHTMTTKPKGFRWENINGHKLEVTWYQERPSKFTYAIIQRMSINKDKQQSLARQPLLITDGQQNISFPKEDLLAVSLTMGKRPNYTLTVILREKQCEYDCIYTCHVPHPFCSGQDEKDCLCPVPATVTLQTSCNSSVSEEKSTTPTTAYVSEENSEACTIACSIVCPLLLAIVLVLGAVIMYMFKRKENNKPPTEMTGIRTSQQNDRDSGTSDKDCSTAETSHLSQRHEDQKKPLIDKSNMETSQVPRQAGDNKEEVRHHLPCSSDPTTSSVQQEISSVNDLNVQTRVHNNKMTTTTNGQG